MAISPELKKMVSGAREAAVNAHSAFDYLNMLSNEIQEMPDALHAARAPVAYICTTQKN